MVLWVTRRFQYSQKRRVLQEIVNNPLHGQRCRISPYLALKAAMRNILLTAVSLVMTIALMGQEYGFDCFLLEDGLPRAHVTTITEDHDGFLLIGTKNGGIARFDGHSFKVQDRNSGLSENDVRCSYADTSDHAATIWLGCGNWIDGFNHGKVTPLSYEFKASINCFAKDDQGLLWVGTAGGGIYQVDDQEVVKADDDAPFKHVNSLLFSNELYAATNSGLFVGKKGRWELISIESPSEKIISIVQAKEGFYIATEQAVALIQKAGNGWTTTWVNVSNKSIRPQCIFFDSEERLWIGTSTGAYKIAANGNVVHFDEESGLSDNDIRTIYQDRSGAVWLGTAYGGVCKFTSEAFIHFSSRSGLGENIVSATLRDKEKGLWIATYGGGVTWVDDQERKRFSVLNGMPSDFVHALCSHPDKGVFAATDVGPVLIQNGRIHRFDGFTSRCTSIISDSKKRLWVASAEGWQLLAYKNGALDLIGMIPYQVGYVSDMDTLNGQLFASTSTGIYMIDLHDLELKHVQRAGMPNALFTSVRVSVNGEIWAGTAEHGLVRVMSDTAEVYTSADGLSADQIELVLLDSKENVWVGTKRGIDMLELDMMQDHVLNVDNYTTADGFIGMEVFRNAGMLDHDGTLWFGTTRGATRYDPKKILYDESEPNTHIMDILLNYEHVDWAAWSNGLDPLHGLPKDLELPYDKNHLTFEFAGISLAYPERVRYQYTLAGFEEEWSPITATHRVTYPQIPPGDYSFKVISRNASGIWNQDPEVFHFSVKAPLWQNKYFLAALILLIAMLVYAAVKLRERNFKQERMRLESMVTDRTKALAQAKKRSEDLLLNILPAPIAKELQDSGKAKAREYEECSVLFSDFQGFTAFSAKLCGDELVEELDKVFRAFDEICDRYNIEKIKTIGDAYMCASGLPDEHERHALNAVLMGLGMINVMNRFNREQVKNKKQQWLVRIGVHTGPLVAGVVGEKKFAYDIWGDTVNTASRMEHASEAGRLNISGVTYSQVMDHIDATVRGPLQVKGKGELMMYFVDRIKPEFSADDAGMVPNEHLLRLLGTY